MSATSVGVASSGECLRTKADMVRVGGR